MKLANCTCQGGPSAIDDELRGHQQPAADHQPFSPSTGSSRDTLDGIDQPADGKSRNDDTRDRQPRLAEVDKERGDEREQAQARNSLR